MSLFLAQMSEGTHIAMAWFIIDFQRLYDAHGGGGFVWLIAELEGCAGGYRFLKSRHQSDKLVHRTATVGVQHRRQGHRFYLTHIGYEALPHLPGDKDIGHGPVQGHWHNPEFVGNGSKAIVAKTVARLGQSERISHRQERKGVAGKLPFMP